MVPPVQGHLLTMRQHMERIHATENPVERQRLLRDHFESMQDSTQMMNGMMSGSMRQHGSMPK